MRGGSDVIFHIIIMSSFITVVHSYLSRDLANERLSKSNQQKRYHHIQLLDSLRTKINSTHPSVQPSVNIPKISHPPPAFKPPPPIPDEPQELYEVPEIKDEAEDYLTFEPSQTDEPQVREDDCLVDFINMFRMERISC